MTESTRPRWVILVLFKNHTQQFDMRYATEESARTDFESISAFFSRGKTFWSRDNDVIDLRSVAAIRLRHDYY
jgi:hypothetical protein